MSKITRSLLFAMTVFFVGAAFAPLSASAQRHRRHHHYHHHRGGYNR